MLVLEAFGFIIFTILWFFITDSFGEINRENKHIIFVATWAWMLSFLLLAVDIVFTIF